MRALWVTAEPPDRGLGGGSIRQAYLIEALARQVETDLLLLGRLDDSRTRAVLRQVTELPIPPPPAPPRSWLRSRGLALQRAYISRTPTEVAHHAGLASALRPALGGARGYDLVMVEHSHLAPLLPRQRRGRWGLTMHQLISRRAEQLLDVLPADASWRERVLRSREVRNARRFEAWACQAFDVTFVTSPEDAAVLPRAVLVPNGVDLALFRPSPLPDAARLIFTGTLDYPPNVDGVSWFCREVLPRIARECPEVQLDIVGRSPEAEVRRLADGRQVRLHADVPAVLPLLQSARVAVVPLRIGSGTRLKALEAMATCRPVIGTTIGLEGLGVRHGREALVVDDAAAMATAIVGLLHDGAQAQALALSARALVEERFGWDRIGRDFTSALLAAIA